MSRHYQIDPIGIVRKRDKKVSIEIFDKYKDALLGLDQFSHLLLLIWFHENDTPAKRATLQVHPRRNRSLPLTGVFATRSPQRPNLVALYTCKILSIQENIITIEAIDVLDGSPLVDIKPYIPRIDAVPEAKVAPWV